MKGLNNDNGADFFCFGGNKIVRVFIIPKSFGSNIN